MDCPHCSQQHHNIACVECGNVLTDDERHYYAGRCETCEREWHAEIRAWRHGGENPTFDAMFGGEHETATKH